MTDYISTRGNAGTRSFEDVLLTGLAEDGGLFVPATWPTLSNAEFEALKDLDYAETAARIMHPFTGNRFTMEETRAMTTRAYAGFSHPATAPLKQLAPDLWLLELFHGPTLAFKDFALQLLGQMFDAVLQQSGKRMTVVGATSGDTGAAAIHACAGLNAVDIAILHPKGRVSDVQRRQMTTIKSPNVLNIALHGNFDDCQDAVKAMFNDAAFRADMQLGAINSINWARVAAQAVYYIYAGLRLGALERPVNFAVPTGNFGDVFAGYVAKKMGFPIGELVVATNQNDILTRFWNTGSYTMEGVQPSISPSMDIQISSNFERYLFDLEDRSAERIRGLMASLRQQGGFTLTDQAFARAKQGFSAERAGENETLTRIQTTRNETGEILDPHSAVGVEAALKRTAKQALTGPMVVLATASPAKFPDAVKQATGLHPALPAHLANLFEIEEQLITLPNELATIQQGIRSAFARNP